VFRAIAALSLISAAAAAPAALAAQGSAALPATAPWWERITVTISGDGEARSCSFETSYDKSRPQSCDVVATKAAMGAEEQGSKSQFTKITFERRFSPGASPDTKVAPGETFLGGQVMALGFSSDGAVASCKVIATSGAMLPQYGCDEAKAERFTASARAGGEPRQGYMTILVYAHSAHMV